jgi:hypothetical protein
MMSSSLHELDEIRYLPSGMADSVSPAVLRQARATLTARWRSVSYALEALALELKVLNRPRLPNENGLHAIIDGLPELLGEGLNGAWPFSDDCSEVVAAVADDAELLDLHRELVSSDLDDPIVAYSLWARMDQRRDVLVAQRHRIEVEIAQLQEILLRQYGNGTASVEDWLA